MSKILDNTTGSAISITDTGVTIPALSQYTIPPQDYLLWAASGDVLSPVGLGDLVVNDGTDDLSPSDGIDLLKGLFPVTAIADPNISNIPVTLAATEYSTALPAGTREFRLRSRKDGILQLAFSAGQTGTTYVTIYPGSTYTRKNLRRSTPLTLYYRSSKPSDVLELEYWT